MGYPGQPSVSQQPQSTKADVSSQLPQINKWGPDLPANVENISQPEKTIEEQAKETVLKLTNTVLTVIKGYYQAKKTLKEGIGRWDEKVGNAANAVDQVVGSIDSGIKEGVERWDEKVGNAANAVDQVVESIDSGIKEGVERWDEKVGNAANAVDQVVESIDTGIEHVKVGVDQFGRNLNAAANAGLNKADEAAGKVLDFVDATIEKVDNKIDQGKQAAKDFVTEVNTEVYKSSTELELEANMVVQETSASIGEKALKAVKMFNEKISKPFARAFDELAETSAKTVVETLRAANNAVAEIEQNTAYKYPRHADALEKGAQFARRVEHGVLSIFQYGMEGKKVADKVRAYDANRRVESVANKLEKQGLGIFAKAIRGINTAINATEARSKAMRTRAEEAKASAQVYLDRANKWGEFKSRIKVNALTEGPNALGATIDASMNQLKVEREGRERRHIAALVANRPELEDKWKQQFQNL